MAKKGGKDKGAGGGGKVKDPTEALWNTEEGRQKLKLMKQAQLREKEEMETRLAKINSTKLMNKWLEIGRQKKTDQLVKETKEAQELHDWRMERKTAEIGRIATELEEAEEQLIQSQDGHMGSLKNFIQVQMDRIGTAHQHFEEELAEIEREFKSERTEAEERHQKQKAELIAMIRRMEQEYNDAEADTKHEFSSQRDDIRNRNLEDKQALRIQMETTIDELWKQFQKDLDDYNQMTAERRSQFEALKTKDQDSARVIEEQTNKLNKLQETANQLKQKISNTHQDCEERNRTLRKEKESVQHHFQQMKHKIGSYRGDERKKLARLAVIGKQVVNSFQERVDKAESILKQMALTRKLETEAEKVVVYEERDDPLQHDPDLQQELAALREQQRERDQATDSGVFQLPAAAQTAVRRFYQRYNKAALDQCVLQHRRHKLQHENARLKLMLQQYFDGFSVSAEVLEAPNSLLIVNNRSNVRADFLQRKAPPRVDGPLQLRTQRLLPAVQQLTLTLP